MAEEFAQPVPIDWNAFLESSQAEAPIACLRPTFKHRLAMHLNKEIVVITTEFCPDWRGLAELIGFDGIEISVSNLLLVHYVETNTIDLQEVVGLLALCLLDRFNEVSSLLLSQCAAFKLRFVTSP